MNEENPAHLSGIYSTGSLLLFLPLFSTEVQLKPREISRMKFFCDNS